MTKAQAISYSARSRQWFLKEAIKEVYEDQDGIWIILNEGYEARNMDRGCRTIHCGGDDEPWDRTVEDLRYQLHGVCKLNDKESEG